MPAWPPMTASRPMVELPATPVWAEMTAWSPMRTLCPIWQRLSILTPPAIAVSSRAPRSTHALAPISTSSPIRARPTCGTLTCRSPSKTKPNPSEPMTAPAWRITRSPTVVPG